MVHLQRAADFKLVSQVYARKPLKSLEQGRRFFGAAPTDKQVMSQVHIDRWTSLPICSISRGSGRQVILNLRGTDGQ